MFSASERQDASLTSLRFAYATRPLAAIVPKDLPGTGGGHAVISRDSPTAGCADE